MRSGVVRKNSNQPDESITQRELFLRRGFVKLHGFFGPKEIETLRGLALSQLHEVNNKFDTFHGNKSFNRLAYDVGNDSNELKEIVLSDPVKGVAKSIVGRDLILAQGLSFELKNNQSGFPWHVGLVSFNYIYPESFGCTIWIPLDEINVDGQQGGMRYVPRDIISGRYLYQRWWALTSQVDCLEEIKAHEKEYNALKFPHPNSVEAKLYDRISIEDDFKVGDALLFDKWVFHRSCPLLPGPMESRLAFAIRFVDAKARYSPNNLRALIAANEVLDRKPPTKFGFTFTDLNDGDEMRLSKFCTTRLEGRSSNNPDEFDY